MAESRPPVPNELRQLSRDQMERILDKACSDPEWKQRLLDDPEAVMAEFPESPRMRELRTTPPEGVEAEVAGQHKQEHHEEHHQQQGCYQCYWSMYWYWDWYSYTWYESW